MISFLGDSALPSVGESFALRGDLLLPIAAKVGKSARRNLRFLHLRAPLPLMPTPNSAFGSIVECMSGSGARRKSMRHT